MDIEELREDWDELGRNDPLWAIMTSPGKRGGKWDRNEFFRTGEREVARLMEQVRSLDVEVARGRALDFGCGVGRLTQALARHFDAVVGVDIAPSMIALAKEFNRHGDRCEYRLNDAPDLATFPVAAFDLVYSNITLQHMPPRYMRRYLAEFLRVLKPTGLAVFQLTSRPGPALWLRSSLSRMRTLVRRRKGVIRMYWMQPSRVRAFLARRGATVLDVRRTYEQAGWTRYQYCVVRPAQHRSAE